MPGARTALCLLLVVHHVHLGKSALPEVNFCKGPAMAHLTGIGGIDRFCLCENLRGEDFGIVRRAVSQKAGLGVVNGHAIIV